MEILAEENLLFEKKINSIQNWYVFYTCPRAEKIVYHDLIEKKYEAFLPVVKTLRIWKNRQRKFIEIPLFPGYIFVNTLIHEVYNIKRLPKIATCVMTGDKPSVVSCDDIDVIKKMLSLEQDVEVSTEFFEGEKVKIVYGPLAGHNGILIKQKGKTRFGIQLKEINHTVLIDICTNVLDKVSQIQTI